MKYFWKCLSKPRDWVPGVLLRKKKEFLTLTFLSCDLNYIIVELYNTEGHGSNPIFLCPLMVDSFYLPLLYNISSLGWLTSSSYILWNLIFHIDLVFQLKCTCSYFVKKSQRICPTKSSLIKQVINITVNDWTKTKQYIARYQIGTHTIYTYILWPKIPDYTEQIISNTNLQMSHHLQSA